MSLQAVQVDQFVRDHRAQFEDCKCPKNDNTQPSRLRHGANRRPGYRLCSKDVHEPSVNGAGVWLLPKNWVVLDLVAPFRFRCLPGLSPVAGRHGQERPGYDVRSVLLDL